MKRAVLLAGMIVLVQACASPPTAANQASAGDPGSERECRSVRSVDSNIPQRICGTKAEWAERDRVEQENSEELDRQRRTVTN